MEQHSPKIIDESEKQQFVSLGTPSLIEPIHVS